MQNKIQMKVTSLIPIDKTKNSSRLKKINSRNLQINHKYSLIPEKNQKGFSTNSPLRVSVFLCDFISEKYQSLVGKNCQYDRYNSL